VYVTPLYVTSQSTKTARSG